MVQSGIRLKPASTEISCSAAWIAMAMVSLPIRSECIQSYWKNTSPHTLLGNREVDASWLKFKGFSPIISDHLSRESHVFMFERAMQFSARIDPFGLPYQFLKLPLELGGAGPVPGQFALRLR